MALYDRRFAQALLSHQQMKAIKASEPISIEGIQGSTVAANSDSELSTVSSSRFSGLEEDWWKEKASGDSDALKGATATVAVMRTRSKGKRVHWE
jgi:hypothetical protein